jgi:hypothetical protein
MSRGRQSSRAAHRCRASHCPGHCADPCPQVCIRQALQVFARFAAPKSRNDLTQPPHDRPAGERGWGRGALRHPRGPSPAPPERRRRYRDEARRDRAMAPSPWWRRQRGQAGRVAPPLQFPAARENSGKKIFRGPLRAEKPRRFIDLATTLSNNRRLGREPAGKPEKPSYCGLATPGHCRHTNSLIGKYARSCYMVRNFAVATEQHCRPRHAGRKGRQASHLREQGR